MCHPGTQGPQRVWAARSVLPRLVISGHEKPVAPVFRPCSLDTRKLQVDLARCALGEAKSIVVRDASWC